MKGVCRTTSGSFNPNVQNDRLNSQVGEQIKRKADTKRELCSISMYKLPFIIRALRIEVTPVQAILEFLRKKTINLDYLVV